MSKLQLRFRKCCSLFGISQSDLSLLEACLHFSEVSSSQRRLAVPLVQAVALVSRAWAAFRELFVASTFASFTFIAGLVTRSKQ